MALQSRKTAQARVTREKVQDRQVIEQQENTATVEVPGAPPSGAGAVEVSLGLTRNMGSYESVRFDIRLTVPCDTTLPGQGCNAAFTAARDWVEERMNELNKAWGPDE